MECTGRIQSINQDLFTGKVLMTLEVNESNILAEAQNLMDCEKLAIEAKKYRQKRSLDANAYAWVLMQKIAEAINSDKWSVYLDCLQNYSRAFTHIIVKENAVEKMKSLVRTCVDLGEVTVNGQTGHQLQLYYGSSTFDTKEMSVFLDGIISECNTLEIPTATPNEIERMKSQWQNQ